MISVSPKVIIIGLAGLALLVAGAVAYNRMKSDFITKGVEQERKRMNTVIADEAKKHRKTEADLRDQLRAYSARYEAERQRKRKVQTETRDRIVERYAEVAKCDPFPMDIIAMRNEIRKEGPR